ncbi:MAG TPA: CrcB family protein [Acidimicrobiales bacterium]
MSPLAWLGFLAAAGVGAPARYLVDGWVQDRTRGAFPWGTLAVNVSGCLALGVVAGLRLHHGLGSTPLVVLGSGLLGGYTTFSTFTFETVRLAEAGALDQALRNVAATAVVGLGAAGAGLAVAAAL